MGKNIPVRLERLGGEKTSPSSLRDGDGNKKTTPSSLRDGVGNKNMIGKLLFGSQCFINNISILDCILVCWVNFNDFFKE